MKGRPRRPGRNMFVHLITRAVRLRKGQAAAAIIAIMVAAAASSAMLNLFTDVQAKLRGEFRRFGANLIVEAGRGQSFSPDELETITSLAGKSAIAVPFAYVVARTDKDQPVVVGATSFQLARELNPWWAVSVWPDAPGEALLGVRAAKLAGNAGARFRLALEGRAATFSARGTVQTGGEEDSRIYISLDDFHAWTGLNPTVVAIAATGNGEEVMGRLQRAFPSADVRPVRQVRVGEAQVLGKTRSTLLFCAAFIIATAALCVIATLTGWVFDRRYDFAIMKALGASDLLITLFILAEASLLGVFGALVGFGAGLGLAAWIGRANFHASIAPRWSVLPPVLLGCLLVALFSTLLPLRLLRRIQPAMILRGE